MEGGDADAREEHEHDEERVARRDGGEADSGPGERDPGRQQPECSPPIRPEPEEWLHEGGGDEHGKHQDGRERVAEIELHREEREQRGDAP